MLRGFSGKILSFSGCLKGKFHLFCGSAVDSGLFHDIIVVKFREGLFF